MRTSATPIRSFGHLLGFSRSERRNCLSAATVFAVCGPANWRELRLSLTSGVFGLTRQAPSPLASCGSMQLADTLVEVLYWSCAGLVGFAYLGYPMLLGVLARFRARPVRRCDFGTAEGQMERGTQSVSVVLTAYNEEAAIGRRIKELAGLIRGAGLVGEVIVVSDGSTDGTADTVRDLARAGGAIPIHLIALPQNVGKAAALTIGWEAAKSEILVFADVRQTWAPDALLRLLENFADPDVGAASGELMIETVPGVMASLGLYWRYEKWLRQREGLIHSTVGLTGAICAVRRHLFRPIPAGTLLDDVYWPLGVVMQGYRVVFDNRAKAFDRLPERIRSEFGRKVRTLCGNFQLLARLPAVLLPWRNPVWFALVSHKLARLAVPWAWLTALLCSAAQGGPLYATLFGLQAAVTLGACLGLSPAVARRSRVASAAASLLVLNVAAWWAFCVWATGGATSTWKKTTYRTPVRPPEPTRQSDLPRTLTGVGR